MSRKPIRPRAEANLHKRKPIRPRAEANLAEANLRKRAIRARGLWGAPLLIGSYLFFSHFVSRSSIPLTSFPNLECFSPAFATAYEFRIWATRCLNWATVITVPADSRRCLPVTRPCVYHTGAGSSRRRRVSFPCACLSLDAAIVQGSEGAR